MRALLFLCSLLIVSACSGRRAESPPTSASPQTAVPIKVEIVHAFVDNGLLNVKVVLEAKTKLQAKDVALVLKGFRNGVLAGKELKPLVEEFGEEEIRPGQRAVVHMVLAAQELTEYQVQCSWGKDAQDLLDSKAPAAAATAVETPEVKSTESVLSFVRISGSKVPLPCETAPCDVMHTLEAVLRNNSAAPVSEIELALGVYWDQPGAAASYPPDYSPLRPDEQTVYLEGAVIEAGAEKKLRITVDKPLPEIEGGSFVPHLRILRHATSPAQSHPGH